MISRLTGTVVHTEPKYLIIDVQGVGYKVAIGPDTLTKIQKNNPVSLWTYLAVREDAMDLYGFLSQSELRFFELLITISGIGPKTAMGILSIASVNALETAIQTQDTTHLTKVSGIGKKVAEKIILELKDKIPDTVESAGHHASMKDDADVLEALKSLGYSPTEARDVLKEIPKSITKTNDRIKEALKKLST